VPILSEVRVLAERIPESALDNQPLDQWRRKEGCQELTLPSQVGSLQTSKSDYGQAPESEVA
jgi:hypothetical protein